MSHALKVTGAKQCLYKKQLLSKTRSSLKLRITSVWSLKIARIAT